VNIVLTFWQINKNVQLYVCFCVTVIHVAALVTFTGEALAMKREVVDKGKTVNITDKTKLTGT